MTFSHSPPPPFGIFFSSPQTAKTKKQLTCKYLTNVTHSGLMFVLTPWVTTLCHSRV